MTQNIYIVQMTKLLTNEPYKLVGVYSSKEKADAAGKEAVEFLEKSHYTVTIKALDDIIDGLNN